MARYRRKTEIVEAAQWFKDGDHPAVRMMYRNHTIAPNNMCLDCWQDWAEHGEVEDPVGWETVCPGDWITAVGHSTHYHNVYKPCDFDATFEPIPERDEKADEALDLFCAAVMPLIHESYYGHLVDVMKAVKSGSEIPALTDEVPTEEATVATKAEQIEAEEALVKRVEDEIEDDRSEVLHDEHRGNVESAATVARRIIARVRGEDPYP